MEITFKINGKPAKPDVDPSMPLLWVVRDELNLKATKFGCGAALCGACTLHIDGEAYRSCSIPVSFAEGKEVTTLEGLSESEDNLHPVQQAWMEENGIGMGKVMQPLRLSLVGAMKGPHLFDIMAMIGKEETISRIQKATEALS